MVNERVVLNENDRRVLAELNAVFRKTLSSVLPADPGASGVAVLDYPSHQNVGDAMIWAGEMRHLGALGVPVKYAADFTRFDTAILDRCAPEATVLLHGGGNLGDIWPEYQGFRESVVESLPRRRIVQLPQTIWFESAAAARRANRVFAAHPDFTLLLREEQSMSRADQWLPDVRRMYCPDAALGMGPQAHTLGTSKRVKLLRRDAESAIGLESPLKSAAGELVDWGLTGEAALAWKLVRIPGKLHKISASTRPWLNPLVGRGYRAMTALNLSAGRRLIGSSSALLTDRLHAHVLACLCGVPHVVLDNSYGKVRAVFDAYTHRFTTATFAANPDEALKLWSDLVAP
jgi:pyruvyl transferase EpsO